MQTVFNADEEKRIQLVKGLFDSNVRIKLLEFPPELFELLINRGVVSGGASASLFHGETPKDYDIYLDSMDSVIKFNELLKRQDILDKIEDVNEKYSIDTLIDGKMVTSRAVTFKNKIQVITMSTIDQRRTFDYLHCMPWFVLAQNKYFISRGQYDSIINKKLVINPAYVPTDKLLQHARQSKFLNRGWKL